MINNKKEANQWKKREKTKQKAILKAFSGHNNNSNTLVKKEK